MTDYWKSNERKFCDFCKCWIADNKPSIQFHENGKRHKVSVAKRITEISKKSAKDEKAKNKMEMDIRKMEDAGMKAYLRDLSQPNDKSFQTNAAPLDENGVSYSIGYGNTTETETTVKGPTFVPKTDPMLVGLPSDDEDEDYRSQNVKRNMNNMKRNLPVKKPIEQTIVPDPANPSLWCEALSEEGHTYYWNVKTNESVWEPPKEGFMKLDEYNKINQQAVKQQEEVLKIQSRELIQNADEIVAKYKREKLKQYRVKEPEEDRTFCNDAYDPVVLAQDAQPFGQWQQVVHKVEKLPDLDLPKQDYSYYNVPVISYPDPPQPVKQFKERVITTLDADVKNEPGFFKKRKLAGGSKMNVRQRVDDD